MDKIAFVFSGQGDQYSGMGRDICEKYSAAAEVYDMCDRLRPETSSQCFNGTEEELKETKNTQPCLFAMEVAAASALMKKGIMPSALAGFSLGEISAAAVSGLLDKETAFRLVCRRGEIMQTEAEKFDTAMAAVIKLTELQVSELCKKYTHIYPVNFNCPGQVTVSGLSQQMPDFFSDVKAAGGRAVPLKVKGAFHSPFMNEAADAFARELKLYSIGKPHITLYSNVTAEPYADDAAMLLSKQICSPVRWEKIIRNMISSGIKTFIEVGPGRTLINMIKKTDDTAAVYASADYLKET